MRLRRVKTSRLRGRSLTGVAESAITNGKASAATATSATTRPVISSPNTSTSQRFSCGCRTTTVSKIETKIPRTRLRGRRATGLASAT